MPIYEYTCKACEAKFDKLVASMSGRDVKVACPECGSAKTAREMSVFAVSDSGKSIASSPGGCGRCGGPGPCPSGY